jgi:polyisoprenoid-binding protein YceI
MAGSARVTVATHAAAAKSASHSAGRSKRRACSLAPFVTLSLASLLLLPPAARAQDSAVTLDPENTKIEFTLDSTLHTVHGTFKLKSGQLHFNLASGKVSGQIVVDAASGDSDNRGRDRKMHQEILESQKYPDIIFTPKKVEGSLNPQAASQVELSGSFRIHGEDHVVTISLTVDPPAGNQLHATAHFSVPYIKWGLKNPSTFILRASDTVDVSIEAVGQLTADTASHQPSNFPVVGERVGVCAAVLSPDSKHRELGAPPFAFKDGGFRIVRVNH